MTTGRRAALMQSWRAAAHRGLTGVRPPSDPRQTPFVVGVSIAVVYVLASSLRTFWCASMYQWYSVPTGAPEPSGACPARRLLTAKLISQRSGATFVSFQSP